MASALLRFQLGSSVRPVSSDNFPKNQAKNLSEIVRFNGSGSFFVRAIVSNFQYRIYNSCPQKNGGVLCRRKLGDNGICPKCGHQSEKPNQNLLIRLELVDLKDQTVKQNVSAFSLTAENFLGLNTEQLSTMANKEPENLAKHLEKNLGRPLSAKISVKMPAQKRKNNEQSSSKKKRFDFRYLGAYFENNPSGVDDVASVQIGGNSSTEGQANSNVATYHRRGGIEEEAPDSDVETQPEKNGEDGNNAPSFAPLFEEKMHYIHKLERFALSRHITEFVLNANYHEHQGDQQFVTASDETLNATFEQLIDQAIKNAEQQSDGRHVSKIGIVLDGKGLNDPIVLPLRPPIQNNAHVLMMELEKIGQSDGDDQVHGGGMNKRSLLLSEAVQISITCLAPPVGSAPRFYPHQHWGYNEKQLIRIRNEDDNFCLFHALVAARAFHDHELHMEQTKHKQTTMLTGQQLVNSKTSKIFCSNYEAFNRLLSNTQLMNKTVAELITAAEIPTNLEAYGLEHIKSVQDYWDKSTPGLYRIVLFEHAPAELPRPLWKGPPGRRFNVTLFLQEGHYNAIKRINSFFNLGRKYCIDCECSYGNDRKHTVNSTSTYIKVHHEKKKGCFIQQIVIPNKKHKYRIVVYDTETRLETLKEGQQRHKVNYLSARAIVEFRRILMTEVTDGYDVLPLSCTIASACMNIFRGIFMEEDQLALVPEAGYERNDRASVFAIKYLDWRSKTEGLQIQHAGNGREKQWKKYKLDGWIEEQNKCIEVLGCYWHGCERCFAPEDLLVDGKSCRELNVATYDRLLQIREPDDDGQCIEVEEVWECEINAQLTKNAEMKTFFDDLGNERGPIDPRAAYCGGRTGPLRLFAEPEADEKISVFDIVSLYPWVNYTTEYPVGIPQIIRPEHDEMFVNWTRPDDLKYHGIYRVRIVPPRGLRIPVLPVKIDERLLFCCCHHCASAFRKRATCVQHKCPHSDAQRAFTGNYTHIELERALESGYRVDRFWRAWHYEECLWTTSRARLKLLDYMQQIDRTEGAHLLYTDTDSVTVMHKKDLVPIKTGQYLGEMSAKQYGFRMLDKLTGNEEFVQKIRGITFDVENSKALQFHHFRQQVLNYAKNNDDDSCGASANIQEDEINCPAIFRYSKIQPMRDSKVITRQQCKRYLPVCQKGIITNDLNVLPFGFE
ncbi:hypothetical protein niasHT_022815 [Heterodera trifolii]|uniref:DNA-directed DNA polymerase n=1 Tax=Heterodera trifolii TaxID=157864 RepID=A0ABD2KNM3_9BILA